MRERKIFKDKNETINKAKDIIEENKSLFNLEDEDIKVVYERGDLNNAFISRSPIGKLGLRVGISKIDYNYSDKALKLLLGHELTHAKFFKKQERLEYVKEFGEGLALALKLGALLGKEVLIKRMILETLCDINAIRIMEAKSEEVDVYFDRGVLFVDKSYLVSGYLPPSQRKLLAEKYSIVKEIDPINFANDFMKVYNKVVDNSESYDLRLESVDLVLKIINETYKDEFSNNDSKREKLEEFKIYRF